MVTKIFIIVIIILILIVFFSNRIESFTDYWNKGDLYTGTWVTSALYGPDNRFYNKKIRRHIKINRYGDIEAILPHPPKPEKNQKYCYAIECDLPSNNTKCWKCI